MRNIQISTDVFQAIWSARRAGEETEEEILRRVLNIGAAAGGAEGDGSGNGRSAGGPGFTDQRYGIHFPEGFEIFRTYLGRDYSARVANGSWVLQGTGEAASSLNQLSALVGPQQENAWKNWKYRTASGVILHIAALRNPAQIQRRRRAR